MKRILFVYHVSSIGGGSYCLLNILKGLDRTTFEPVVLLRNNGPLVQEIQKLGIDVHFLKTLRTVPYNSSTISIKALKNAATLLRSFQAFRNLVASLNIDAIYLNTMMLYPYLRIAKECGKTSIIHVREHWPEREHRWQRKQAINHIKKYADKIIAINTYSASMLEEKKAEVTIVYDWIDMESRNDNRTMSELIGQDTTNLKFYLYTGGLQPIKGAIEVVHAFSEAVKDPNARLLAVGLDAPIPQGGLKGCFKFLLNKVGYKSYSQKLFEKIISDNRILCLPSTYMMTSIIKQCYCYLSYFTIPHANLALAECIILNIPGIAARTSESEEYSVNGSLAFLYPINDFKAFRQQISSLSDKYADIKRNLELHSTIVRNMFDRERNITILNKTLKSI